MFANKVDAPFHFTKFEDSNLDGGYDLVIMSESCQYIPIEKVFEMSQKLLNAGYLMICDYFVVDQDAGELSKSGHDYNEFLRVAEFSPFEIVSRLRYHSGYSQIPRNRQRLGRQDSPGSGYSHGKISATESISLEDSLLVRSRQI